MLKTKRRCVCCGEWRYPFMYRRVAEKWFSRDGRVYACRWCVLTYTHRFVRINKKLTMVPYPLTLRIKHFFSK